MTRRKYYIYTNKINLVRNASQLTCSSEQLDHGAQIYRKQGIPFPQLSVGISSEAAYRQALPKVISEQLEINPGIRRESNHKNMQYCLCKIELQFCHPSLIWNSTSMMVKRIAEHVHSWAWSVCGRASLLSLQCLIFNICSANVMLVNLCAEVALL